MTERRSRLSLAKKQLGEERGRLSETRSQAEGLEEALLPSLIFRQRQAMKSVSA